MSVQNSVVSEYTNMVLLETQKGKPNADSTNAKKVCITFSLQFENIIFSSSVKHMPASSLCLLSFPLAVPDTCENYLGSSESCMNHP